MSAARLLSILLALALGAPALGAPDANAKRLYLGGLQAYDAGRYDEAIRAFEAAYRLAPADLLVFDLAQAYRKHFVARGDGAALERAIALYRQFLATAYAGRERELAGNALGELLVIAARAPAGASTPKAPVEPPRATEIMVVTEARGATVELDGKPGSPAPLFARVEPGEHRARVSAPGYYPGEVRITAVDGRFVAFEARLEPKPGKLSVSGRAGAELTVDGAARGALPMEALELPPGAHHVAVRLRGFRVWEQELSLENGGQLSLTSTLAPTRVRRAVPWVGALAGLLGASSVASGAVWGAADAQAQTLYTRWQAGEISEAERSAYEDARTRRNQAQVATLVTLAVGASLAITTAGLYWLERR